MRNGTVDAAALEEILDEAIRGCGAVRGNVQVFNAPRRGLEIVAQRGFTRQFLELFDLVTPAGPSTSACARAFRLGRRVMVADVLADPDFAPYVAMAKLSGFQAVQSTPILLDGRVVGVLSTHFEQPTELSAAAAQVLDECAASIARLIGDAGQAQDEAAGLRRTGPQAG